eukprot:tig00001214_g7553.t1
MSAAFAVGLTAAPASARAPARASSSVCRRPDAAAADRLSRTFQSTFWGAAPVATSFQSTAVRQHRRVRWQGPVCEDGQAVIDEASASGSQSNEAAISVSNVWFSWERHAQMLKAASASTMNRKQVADKAVSEATVGPDGQPLRFVLQGTSLEIPRGQVWMLLGANGSGKSTMLQLLLGLVRPDRGSIRIRAPVGFVHQNPDHQVFMPTVGSDVAFGLGNAGYDTAEVKTIVREALDLVGLPEFESRPVYTLSGGQKQRVAIAGAVARKCNTLLLDEPTAFLDPPQRRSLAQHVRRIAQQTGIAALWITHYFEELENCDGAILLEKGKIAVAGKPEEVRRYIEQHYESAR